MFYFLQHVTITVDEVSKMEETSECLKASAEDLAVLDESTVEKSDDGIKQKHQFSCPSCMGRYQQPRVLHCLHVLCTPCLEKLSVNEEDSKAVGQLRGDSKVMVCPVCKQESHIGAIGELPLDVVVMNMMDMDDICAMRMLCTSCKAQENAVARCSDCASFLCPNCVTAHKYMRCFENHKVTRV